VTSCLGVHRDLKGGSDTIVALATTPGRSALGIVRLSGDRAVEIAGKHTRPWPLKPRETRLCRIYDNEEELDQAIVVFYAAPESFTGEDVVEITMHGGYVVPASVMGALIKSGAREAFPGEFTRRAVLNNKIDIVQAEAIGDLIDARSSAMQRAAVVQLDGGLSARISLVRQGILGLESLIAYDVDFPEEDDGPVSRLQVTKSADSVLALLDQLLSTIPIGEIVREGAVVVIAGEPNVGKSSLFNALLGQNRAIVTEIAGTTRDVIDALINADRWPIRLIDTAGLRESKDVVERLGIELSERHVSGAHLVIACGDTPDSVVNAVGIVSELTSAPVLPVLTKSDLVRDDFISLDEIYPYVIRVSSTTGDGLDLLRSRIETELSEKYGELTVEFPVLTRVRHIQGISSARAEIKEFATAWKESSLPATVAAVHLRAASLALEDLIGAVSTEDVLERVFSSFCVGK
jgi:tRNA modification GTPase